jgi:hypothetical protein
MRVIAAMLALSLVGCAGGGGGFASAVPSNTVGSAPGSPTTTSTSATTYACPTAATSSGTLDCTKLPIGDQKYSLSTAQVGSIFACVAGRGTPPVSSAPWLSATTWNMLAKTVVGGSVSWPGFISIATGGATRTIVSNGVPVAPITTGVFPIAASDPAYQYDGNPNSIAERSISHSLPANPTVASAPSCLGMGPIGITVTGVAIYNAFDAADGDALAREEQDACHGHPDQSSTYHYHGMIQTCVPDTGSATQNSSLLGYALDGFGIYGAWYSGKILTTGDLDSCHGITSPVVWNGRLTSIYHYVSTYDFPYTLGCYRGSAAP